MPQWNADTFPHFTGVENFFGFELCGTSNGKTCIEEFYGSAEFGVRFSLVTFTKDEYAEALDLFYTLKDLAQLWRTGKREKRRNIYLSSSKKDGVAWE